MEIDAYGRQRMYALITFVVFSLSVATTRVFTLKNGVSGDAQLPLAFFDLTFSFLIPLVAYLLAKADIEQK